MAQSVSRERISEEKLDVSTLREIGQQLRVDSIRCSTEAGSGHPTSSMSAADLIAVLASRHLRYDWNRPDLSANDHLIFSKGHASPLLYAMFKAVGAVTDEELVSTYRQFGSRLQGHPTPVLPWVDVATGSLGQGLPIGVGIALAGRYLDQIPYHVWVLCGDSEMAEGSMWEALDKASFYELGNLTAIVDVNRLGQRGPTEFGWDIDVYERRAQAFGCAVDVIDGHDIHQIDRALMNARRSANKPTVVVARTIKGRGFSEVEDKEGWHGKALPRDMADRAIIELGGIRDRRIATDPPDAPPPPVQTSETEVQLPQYPLGEAVATRRAFGDALTALGRRGDIVSLDAEVGNSTYSELFLAEHPGRYFEIFIAEQQLISAAVGFSVRGYVAFASTFAAFFSRAADFVRMAGVSGVDIRLCGSHGGVEIGADGPSQMGLEDLALMRAIHGSTVLYPSDATSTAQLVALMVEQSGVVYLRATRGSYPVIYDVGENFSVGGSKVVRSSPTDSVTLVGAGVTLHECLVAAEELSSMGIGARVVDAYSIKPLDVSTLVDAATATKGRIVVVEDHYPEGGLGEAVLKALVPRVSDLTAEHLAVRDLPGSGKPAELLDAAGISRGHIAEAARRLLT